MHLKFGEDALTWADGSRRLARGHRAGYGLPRGRQVPAEAVDRWVEAARRLAIRSIICLLADEHLKLYDAVAGGLLSRYVAAGFEVAHIPVRDHCDPPMSDDELQAAWEAFCRLPGPVLVHCSAGIDRTGAAVEYILGKLNGEGPMRACHNPVVRTALATRLHGDYIMSTQTIAFTKVRLPHGWLGNMSPYSIVLDGTTWRTAEALFQALRFDDAEIREEIRAQQSPMGAKMVAKKHRARMVVEPQSAADIENMRTVLRLKLSQHPELSQELIRTGDALIIEDCSQRPRGSGLFWGAALQQQQWVGQNQLGKLWMELRNELARGPKLAQV
jgi:ribA/ribD-fused uncharacterized protein